MDHQEELPEVTPEETVETGAAPVPVLEETETSAQEQEAIPAENNESIKAEESAGGEDDTLSQLLSSLEGSDEDFEKLLESLPGADSELSHLIEELPNADGEFLHTEDSSEASGVPQEDTKEIPGPQKTEISGEEIAQAEAPAPKAPIPFSPTSALHQMKKKQVAGPEKRYYDVSEQGVGKLQLAIILNLIILGLSVAASILYSMDLIPDRRFKLLMYSQILALLGSGLLGSNLLVDGLYDLFHLRFSINTILTITFGACIADVWFCIQELRVPCCAAFALEMILALTAKYHKRSNELAQLDTMRKAIKLVSIVREPDYHDGKDGILRGAGDVDDFMETYEAISGPEKVQNAYCMVALLASIGIAVLAGMLHGISNGVQIFAIALMASVPASFFVALTRPMAILEKRLHMVGTVLCGWQGVKKLCIKSVFPLTDEDLFPRGSTKLNGVKFYSDHSPDEVIAYTTSLICQAGGGLVNVFRNLLNNRSGKEYPVENFRDYGTGGIGGEIGGEPVLLGTLNFLQDMGVEIPQGTTVSQAVYVAIDGQLAAVAAISYAKMRSSSAGLLSLVGCRKVKPLLLAGDFMLTEEFIRNKFSVSSRKLVMPEKDVRQELARKQPDPEADVLALATRDDLVSSVYAVTGACALRTASRLGLLIHILGGISGMLIMLALAYIGSVDVLTPSHIFLYQLVWLIPGFLATEWTRHI